MTEQLVVESRDLDWKLCMAQENILYFTPLEPEAVTGDDWNDVPAYCNASHPYNTPYAAVVIMNGYLRANEAMLSADDYARKVKPILVTDSSWQKDGVLDCEIYAGITLGDFIRIAELMDTLVLRPVMIDAR